MAEVGANERGAWAGVAASVIIAAKGSLNSGTRLARNEGCVQACDRDLVWVHAILVEAFARTIHEKRIQDSIVRRRDIIVQTDICTMHKHPTHSCHASIYNILMPSSPGQLCINTTLAHPSFTRSYLRSYFYMKPILMQESSKEYQQVVNNATEVAVLSCNPRNNLGKGSNNLNGNLRWFLPLGVDLPPPPPP